MAVWKFCLPRDYSWHSGIEVDNHYSFKDQQGIERLRIDKNGVITVTENYAWDGCSPKIRFFDWFYLGTPDGVLRKSGGKPVTYHASLIHDALYQFMDHADMPYTRQMMDNFFLAQLKESQFSLRLLYFLVVRCVGGLYHRLAQWLK